MGRKIWRNKLDKMDDTLNAIKREFPLDTIAEGIINAMIELNTALAYSLEDSGFI